MPLVLGLSVDLARKQGVQATAPGLALTVASRGSSGTTATLRITGTLRMAVAERATDGTTATLRII